MSENSDGSPPSESNIRRWAESLNDISPARLQEVRLIDERFLALGLYRQSLVWLVADLILEAPQLWTSESLADLNKKDSKKPLSLFMAAHFRGASLEHAEVRAGFGRVLWLSFAKPGGENLELELRLFARGANAIARAGDKEVALRKPLPLKVMLVEEANAEPVSAKPSPPHFVDGRAKKIAKLQKAIAKVTEEITAKTTQRWAEAGEWLKAEQKVSGAPEGLQPFIEPTKSFVWNMQNCFDKSKSVQKKIAGTRARLAELETEMARETAAAQSLPQPAANTVKAPTKKLLADAEARGRTFELDGGFHFFVGRSAGDNLKLLREAKPWHYWLHLRDYPGSHGILVRNKNQHVGEHVLQRAAHHLLCVQLGDKKIAKYDREKFEILVAECRFVRPIRGDRLGQVTYSQTRSFLHQFSAQKS